MQLKQRTKCGWLRTWARFDEADATVGRLHDAGYIVQEAGAELPVVVRCLQTKTNVVVFLFVRSETNVFFCLSVFN